jgi:integrase
METRPLTRTEIKSILKQAEKPRDKALLVLGFNSGYRISELLSLRVKDVYVLKNGRWQVCDIITIAKDKLRGQTSRTLNPVKLRRKAHLVGLCKDAWHGSRPTAFWW